VSQEFQKSHCRQSTSRNSSSRFGPENTYPSGLVDDAETITTRRGIWLSDDRLKATLYPPVAHPKERVGRASDESKITCRVRKMNPSCIVYSLGGNNQWAFEQDVLNQTDCEVHSCLHTGWVSQEMVTSFGQPFSRGFVEANCRAAARIRWVSESGRLDSLHPPRPLVCAFKVSSGISRIWCLEGVAHSETATSRLCAQAKQPSKCHSKDIRKPTFNTAPLPSFATLAN
jgi:Methyltransferase domain